MINTKFGDALSEGDIPVNHTTSPPAKKWKTAARKHGIFIA
jgi:hypothetical protein